MLYEAKLSYYTIYILYIKLFYITLLHYTYCTILSYIILYYYYNSITITTLLLLQYYNSIITTLLRL